jgi:hypothetical protein
MRISPTTLAAGTLLSLVLGAASPCSAASITYDVNQIIGAGSVTGDIVTDGTIGPLNPYSNFVDWNLLWKVGTTTFDLLGPLSGSNSELESVNPALSATPTQLLFDFNVVSADSFFFFANTTFPEHEVCLEASPSTCVGGVPAGAEVLALFTSNGVGDIVEFTALSGTQVIGTAMASVPAPLIGHGLPVVLAVGGLLFGAKIWEQSKSRRSFGTAIPRAVA